MKMILQYAQSVYILSIHGTRRTFLLFTHQGVIYIKYILPPLKDYP